MIRFVGLRCRSQYDQSRKKPRWVTIPPTIPSRAWVSMITAHSRISITTAAGRGAQAGVLIKDAEALERMAGVDTLIVDKTGTLTMGKPKLTDTVALGDVTETDLLSLAAALERGSEHPLAEAIVEGAEAQGAPRQEATDFDAVARKLQDEWSVLGRKITDSLGPDSAFNRNMTEFDNKVTETIRKTADNISAAMARRRETEARAARDEAALRHRLALGLQRVGQHGQLHTTRATVIE